MLTEFVVLFEHHRVELALLIQNRVQQIRTQASIPAAAEVSIDSYLYSPK